MVAGFEPFQRSQHIAILLIGVLLFFQAIGLFKSMSEPTGKFTGKEDSAGFDGPDPCNTEVRDCTDEHMGPTLICNEETEGAVGSRDCIIEKECHVTDISYFYVCVMNEMENPSEMPGEEATVVADFEWVFTQTEDNSRDLIDGDTCNHIVCDGETEVGEYSGVCQSGVCEKMPDGAVEV